MLMFVIRLSATSCVVLSLLQSTVPVLESAFQPWPSWSYVFGFFLYNVCFKMASAASNGLCYGTGRPWYLEWASVLLWAGQEYCMKLTKSFNRGPYRATYRALRYSLQLFSWRFLDIFEYLLSVESSDEQDTLSAYGGNPPCRSGPLHYGFQCWSSSLLA